MESTNTDIQIINEHEHLKEKLNKDGLSTEEPGKLPTLLNKKTQHVIPKKVPELSNKSLKQRETT